MNVERRGFLKGLGLFAAGGMAGGCKLVEDERYRNHGHGGGDSALMRDFLEAVDTRDEPKLSSSVRASVESHLMGFACEKSRLMHQKVDVVV